MSRLACLLVALVALLAAAAQPAAGATLLARNASAVSLKVDAQGRAVVYYTIGGRSLHPVLWGAVNARPPSQSSPQVEFKIDYSGGFKRLGVPLWKTIKNTCTRYDGPKLAWFVTGCKASDGSYWAVQAFQRLLPNLGMDPWLDRHRANEFYVSHWTGELPKLEAYAGWFMSTRRHEVFGKLTYLGQPVHGFESDRYGAPLDAYGRLIYLDTYNSALGTGWKRENSFLARQPDGHFCYGFFFRKRYGGYPPGPERPPGNGQQYRITAGGPGVTPFVSWIGDGLPDYDASVPRLLQIEQETNAIKPSIVGGDEGCMGN
jgi:hypothetical protein